MAEAWSDWPKNSGVDGTTHGHLPRAQALLSFGSGFIDFVALGLGGDGFPLPLDDLIGRARTDRGVGDREGGRGFMTRLVHRGRRRVPCPSCGIYTKSVLCQGCLMCFLCARVCVRARARVCVYVCVYQVSTC